MNSEQTPQAPAPKPRRRRGRAAVAAAVATAALAALPSLAGAQNLQHVAIGTHVSSGNLVLDVSNAATYPGAPVIQWYGNFGTNQRWNIQDVSGTPYEEIVNQNSGQCLTTDGTPGHWLYQWPCSAHPGWQQLWKSSLSQGPFATWAGVQSADGQYLDVEGNSGQAGAHLITWMADNTNGEYFDYYQLW
jgi:hypothetical protein